MMRDSNRKISQLVVDVIGAVDWRGLEQAAAGPSDRALSRDAVHPRLFRPADGRGPGLCIFLIFVQRFFVVTGAGKSLGLDGLIARSQAGPFTGSGFFARTYRKLA